MLKVKFAPKLRKLSDAALRTKKENNQETKSEAYLKLWISPILFNIISTHQEELTAAIKLGTHCEVLCYRSLSKLSSSFTELSLSSFKLWTQQFIAQHPAFSFIFQMLCKSLPRIIRCNLWQDWSFQALFQSSACVVRVNPCQTDSSGSSLAPSGAENHLARFPHTSLCELNYTELGLDLVSSRPWLQLRNQTPNPR